MSQDPNWRDAVGDGKPVQNVSYTIFLDGSTYKARNGTTGDINYSGTVKATVVQSANDALTSGGIIWLKDMSKPAGLTLSDDVLLIIDDSATANLLALYGKDVGFSFENKAAGGQKTEIIQWADRLTVHFVSNVTEGFTIEDTTGIHLFRVHPTDPTFFKRQLELEFLGDPKIMMKRNTGTDETPVISQETDFIQYSDKFVILMGAIGTTPVVFQNPLFTDRFIIPLDGDVETPTAGKGLIVKTPDGNKRYRIRVDNTGAIVTEEVT